MVQLNVYAEFRSGLESAGEASGMGAEVDHQSKAMETRKYLAAYG